MLLRRMTHADIALGMRLKAQNSWNQLEADWRRQLELEPNGGFVAELDGQGVGTACACVFGDVAWVSMVLVDRDYRNQGIGTALMRHLLQYLDERVVPTIRLDATPLGRPVYEKLGFECDFGLTRYDGMLATAERVGDLLQIMPEDLPEVSALDQNVTHTPREKLLSRIFAANPSETRKYAAGGNLQGFLMCRPGSNAWQIGPVVGSTEAGRHLLLDATQRFAGKRVYVDVPVDHPGAANFVKSIGLKPQRQFLRMTRGKRVREDLHHYWASGGPEKG